MTTISSDESAAQIAAAEDNKKIKGLPPPSGVPSGGGLRFARVVALALGISVVAALGCFSLWLAAMRIYQVDECMEVYVARILATGNIAVAGHVTLFQVILSFFLHGPARSADLIATARLLMVLLFWTNWILMALATGEKLFSPRWFFALIGAATLAPLWDYGFEVRHDNLLLMGVLLIWGVVRFQPPRLSSYFFVGAIAAILEFVAFKSCLYTVPLSLAILIFPPPGSQLPKWESAIALIAGLLGTLFLIRVAFGWAGIWDLYLVTVNFLSTAATGGTRFWPLGTLGRLLTQSPLLLALWLSGITIVAMDIRKRGTDAFSWKGNFPEALLFLGVLVVLTINPAPYPYNLLHLVPYGFLFAFRHGCELWKEVSIRPKLYPLAASVIIFAQFVPFYISTQRHFDRSNTRQEILMKKAEILTDPTKDPVYDAIGMVPTRPIVDTRAFLHSLNFERYVKSSEPRVREMLAANPAAVLIPSYRTDWLSERDHDFIRKHYVALADDFWVLGKSLPAGGGTVEIIHAGRYRISTLAGSDLQGSYPSGMKALLSPEEAGNITGTLDGQPITAAPMELTVGTHHIETASDCAVVWMGPHLDRIHRLGESDHDQLFVNWY